MKSLIDKYLEENNVDKKLIYTHKDSNRKTSENRLEFVYNKEKIYGYHYIAQYFTKYDLIIIWDKSLHKEGSYCYNADFRVAIKVADNQTYSFQKVVEFQTWKMSTNYACYSRDIESLLNLICKGE